jgi:hypothetical protein
MRARRIRLGLATAVVAALASQAVAQAPGSIVRPPQTAAPERIEEVVVRGRRMSEIDADLRVFVRSFIDEVVRLPAGRGFARWQRRVCVSVHNLQSDAAQYIVDRISALALELGLEPGEPGCNPDVIVIFTIDAKHVATQLVESAPRLFRPAGGLGDMTLSRATLAEFAASERPVRWWHVSLPVDARTGQTAIRLPGQPAPVVSVAGPSKIHDGIRDDLQHVIIIVDGTKLTGTTWQELGDYLAVISLAQIDPDATPAAFDSILNLFSNPAAYSGLTDWDRSYLRALYEFDQERRPQAQTGDLVSHMARRERGSGAEQ